MSGIVFFNGNFLMAFGLKFNYWDRSGDTASPLTLNDYFQNWRGIKTLHAKWITRRTEDYHSIYIKRKARLRTKNWFWKEIATLR
jgi:hypothetical protein